MNENTRELLLKHYKSFPCLQAEDIFKFLFQSAFGCEHLAADEASALQYIKKEYDGISGATPVFTDALDGNYSRVYLSWLNEGLSPETLTKLFCLSARPEPDGKAVLAEKTEVARELIASGAIPLDKEEFEKKLSDWQGRGCPAIHHSQVFRSTYRPAYRVIDNRYADFMRIFAGIDKLSADSSVIFAIEGGSASGKSTLADALSEVYDCNVFHTDDYFLRPGQRTPERFAEIGGNLDRERLYDEIILPLLKNEAVCYRPFDCSSQTLGEAVTVMPKKITVIEGAYSMHPYFGEYYNLSVFLDIDPDFQKKRIEKRNSPAFAKRFFEEWIPLEVRYFEKTEIKKRAGLVIPINAKNR